MIFPQNLARRITLENTGGPLKAPVGKRVLAWSFLWGRGIALPVFVYHGSLLSAC